METLKDPKVATRIFHSIREQLLTLDHMPNRHPIITEEPYAARGIRIIPVEIYMTFYYVDNAAKTIHIVRILYNRGE